MKSTLGIGAAIAAALSSSYGGMPSVENKHDRLHVTPRGPYISSAVDRSRYMPHQGKREIARRLRQAEKAGA